MTKKSGSSKLVTILILIAAIAVWVIDKKRDWDKRAEPAGKPQLSRNEAKPTVARDVSPKPAAPVPQASGKPSRQGNYEVHRGCTLVDYRNNDGDSFMLRLPDGRQAEFRLYYVDTPESAFKSYRGGETNHGRISQQAQDLGGITPQQAVEIGKQAKHFTLGLLGREPFTIYTDWDSPYNDNRYHAFLQVKVDGKPRWLHQVLVEKGFVRVITKPADLPDGTPVSKERALLRKMEGDAKRAGAGAWGLK